MLTDYPKYVGFEGHPESFAAPIAGDAETFATYDFVVADNSYDAANTKLNEQFALSNVNWNNQDNHHMSELYVRIRDVLPLVVVARDIMDLLPAIEQVDLRDALERLVDMK